MGTHLRLLGLCHDKRAHIRQILKLLTTIKPTLMCLNPLIMSTGHRTFTQPTGKSREDVPPTRLNTVLKAIRRHTKAPKFQKWIRNPKQQPLKGISRNGTHFNANDPLAGSPTRTLLRLLLPLNAQVWKTSSQAEGVNLRKQVQISH